jgi:hypothetical protein
LRRRSDFGTFEHEHVDAAVANFCTSAAAACPSGLAKARWIAATSSKCSVATSARPDGPAGVATDPLLTSYLRRPGIFFAIGTCVLK